MGEIYLDHNSFTGQVSNIHTEASFIVPLARYTDDAPEAPALSSLLTAFDDFRLAVGSYVINLQNDLNSVQNIADSILLSENKSRNLIDDMLVNPFGDNSTIHLPGVANNNNPFGTMGNGIYKYGPYKR